MDEDPPPPCANSQDQAMADDDDSFTDALEVYEDAPSTSQSSHAQVMAGIDEDPTGVSENWGDRSTSSHSNQALTPQNILSQTFTAPKQTSLLPDSTEGHFGLTYEPDERGVQVLLDNHFQQFNDSNLTTAI